LETSEEAPPPEAVTRWLRSYAALGILKGLAGLLFGRPGGAVSPERFSDYDRAITQVVCEEEGLTRLPVITHVDFGHTDPMCLMPYGLQAEINCETQELAVRENAVGD
jgi:muramoyltetrapeptide carboxypeptidase LdcA involved in peptidoglycan recycling